MKIKQKKQVNLLELINWAWENDIKNKFYPLNNSTGKIGFDHDGDLMVITEEDFDEVYVKKSETFEIEEEVEIDGDTKLDFIAIKENKESYTYPNFSINGMLEVEMHDHYDTKFVYLLNEDGTIGDLIWENGRMVD